MKQTINKETFNILSIDGGGIRGLIPAMFLDALQKKRKNNLISNFDLVCGTSTGALIALAFAMEIPMDKVVTLYKEKGDQIFPKQSIFKKLWNIKKKGCMYDSKILEEEVNKIFNYNKVKDLKINTLIPSANLSHKRPRIFKTSHEVCHPKKECFFEDEETLLKDIALATAAAPYYFSPKKIKEQFFWDGGIWCNNPSLAGFIEAKRITHPNRKKIKILSLGTGSKYISENKHSEIMKKIIYPWDVIPCMLDIQSRSIDNQLEMLREETDIYERIDCGFTKPIGLDDASAIADLEGKANLLIQDELSKVLRNFFEEPAEKIVNIN